MKQRRSDVEQVREALNSAREWHRVVKAQAALARLEARVKEQGERADNLQRAYELKIDDLRRETLRASTLQEALNKEHQALTELWERHEKMRRALSADTEAPK